MNRHTQIKRVGYIEEISDNFDKMKEGYFNTEAAKSVKFGDAECILCDAKKLYEVTGKILEKEMNCFIDREAIPSAWYEEK
jgi:aminoglycoside 3-N-acetyltransferase